jgi:hypothetical protein
VVAFQVKRLKAAQAADNERRLPFAGAVHLPAPLNLPWQGIDREITLSLSGMGTLAPSPRD